MKIWAANFAPFVRHFPLFLKAFFPKTYSIPKILSILLSFYLLLDIHTSFLASDYFPVNVNDEVFERFDFTIYEFEKVRESGEVVTLRAENGGGESLGFSDVKIPFHIPLIVKPQKQYRILVNNSKEPFQHVWLQRSEDG
ncbi:hypothetical protein AgCh_009576 [Apium graveolens]